MVDSLVFNVAQLLRESIGAVRHVEVAANLQHLAPELEQAEGAPEATLSGPVRMIHTNTGVLVQGHLYAEAALACARCLDPVAVPLTIDVEELFIPTVDVVTGKPVTPEEDDRALWIDEHHILDLNEVLRQDALLAAPVHVLCKENCRGLCPTCGENLNNGPCGCAPDIDPRWGPLVELLKQTK